MSDAEEWRKYFKVDDLEEERDKLLLQNDALRKDVERLEGYTGVSFMAGVIRERDEALRLNQELQNQLKAQHEDLWEQIKVFRDHNLKLYGENCTALDALETVSKLNTQTVQTVDQVKEYAKLVLARIEKLQPDPTPIEKRIPPMPKLDGPEPTLSPEDQAALDAIKCQRCGLPGLRCVFCTPASSSTCGH